jgi:MoxR-like ATPase
MTTATSDNDQRRKKFLDQLAAILQVDGPPPDKVATPSEAAVSAFTAKQEAASAGLSSQPLAGSFDRQNGQSAAASIADQPAEFVPIAPSEFSQFRLSEAEVESLALKFLMHRHSATGCEISEQLAIPFAICDKLLYSLKTERLVVLKATVGLNDFLYELTEAGTQRACKFAEHCRYFGAAPVCLADYETSVAAQSLQNGVPEIADLRRAFADLMLAPDTFERLGRAIVSGKGLFLHGPPGNGKTSIAQRVTRAFGETIWIPKAISAWGEIIRVYDPSCHEEMPPANGQGLIDEAKVDRRWVRIRRPTIVVGGELVLDNLEITPNLATGVAEAPLQLKSNCGTLVIDDFGRQQVAPAALLNRWIVPLEKRYDYLNLTSGRKIRVPFDQFVIFSTNLQPRDLVDEAFLRRIPYKIDVCGPSEDQFRDLFLQLAHKMGIELARPPLDHLVEEYYRKSGRTMRFCHPRDLLRQIKVYYEFLEQAPKLSVEAIDAAATDYFSVL